MIKVTFEFDTTDAAMDFLADCMPQGAKADTAAAPAGEKRGRGRPRKEAPVDPTPPATAPSAAPVAVAPATPAPATPEVTTVPFAALVDPLTQLADKDLDAAVAILGKFGVKTARELKPEQFGPVLQEVNAALNKPAARASLI